MIIAHPLRLAMAGLCGGLVLAAGCLRAADVEAQSSVEVDVRVKLNEEGTTRLMLLNSWARHHEENYSETVFGAALDHRLSPDWSVRAGVRRITEESDSPEGNETRAVLDARYFLPFGEGWLLTDRSRVDLRMIEGGSFSARFRNRVMLEKPFTLFDHEFTGFGSYELFYDTRHQAFSRHSLTLGISVPLGRWLAADVFFTKDYAINPPKDTVGAFGLALCFDF